MQGCLCAVQFHSCDGRGFKLAGARACVCERLCFGHILRPSCCPVAFSRPRHHADCKAVCPAAVHFRRLRGAASGAQVLRRRQVCLGALSAGASATCLRRARARRGEYRRSSPAAFRASCPLTFFLRCTPAALLEPCRAAVSDLGRPQLDHLRWPAGKPVHLQCAGLVSNHADCRALACGLRSGLRAPLPRAGCLATVYAGPPLPGAVQVQPNHGQPVLRATSGLLRMWSRHYFLPNIGCHRWKASPAHWILVAVGRAVRPRV